MSWIIKVYIEKWDKYGYVTKINRDKECFVFSTGQHQAKVYKNKYSFQKFTENLDRLNEKYEVIKVPENELCNYEPEKFNYHEFR